jgi:hypothetical protein
MINLGNGHPPAFIGYEANTYLQQYLQSRKSKENLTLNSLLFTRRDKLNGSINTKDLSRIFQRTLERLKKDKQITYQHKTGKPNQLHLYSLVNFFQNNTKEYRRERRTTSKSENNEYFRTLYKQKAMPNIGFDPMTDTRLQHLTERLDNRDIETKALKETVRTLQPLVKFMNSFDDYENLKTIVNYITEEIFDQNQEDDKFHTDGTFSPYIALQLKQIAKNKGITEKEALKSMFAANVERMKKTDQSWTKIEKHLKLKRKTAKTS